MRIYLFATLSLAACTSTYHPEYHPVTATTITQTYSGGSIPANVAGVTPMIGPGSVIVQTPREADPDAFFDTPSR